MLGVVAVLETHPDEQKERDARAIKCACGEHLKAEDGEARYLSGRGSAWIKSTPRSRSATSSSQTPLRPKVHNME
jgi:hypothetical protein